MLNYEIKRRRKSFLDIFTNSIYEIGKNKFFKFTFIAILLKSLLFIALISDDKANGINPMRVFYSMPPVMVYLSFIAIVVSFGFLFRGKGQIIAFLLLIY